MMPSSLGARIVARDHQVRVDSHDHHRRGSDDDFDEDRGRSSRPSLSPTRKETRDGGHPMTTTIVVVDATSTTTGTIVVVTIAVVD